MSRALLLAVLLAATAGCVFPWEPASGPAYGNAVYPDGSPARCAIVIVADGISTVSNGDGHFWVPVPQNADTLTIWADEYPRAGASIGSRWGFVRVPAQRGPIHVRIVLDKWNFI